MRKGFLALEYVVKLAILLVVAFVVINLIFYFSGETKTWVTDLFFPKEEKVETEIVKPVFPFTNNQVKSYVKSCWDKTGEDYDKDVVCYNLKGDFNKVDWQINKLKPGGINLKLKGPFPQKGIVMVRFKDIGDKIILEGG